MKNSILLINLYRRSNFIVNVLDEQGWIVIADGSKSHIKTGKSQLKTGNSCLFHIFDASYKQ